MIILTGFMGAGKTTVGKVLARELRLPFVDLDEQIEALTGLSPARYIPRFGEPAFRKIESLCLRRVLGGASCVLAAGGGAVLGSANRQRMLAGGFVVWLDTPLEAIRHRIPAGSSRPLFPKTFSALRDLYRNRIPFYRSHHFRIRDPGPPQAVAISILKSYKQFQCTRSC